MERTGRGFNCSYQWMMKSEGRCTVVSTIHYTVMIDARKATKAYFNLTSTVSTPLDYFYGHLYRLVPGFFGLDQRHFLVIWPKISLNFFHVLPDSNQFPPKLKFSLSSVIATWLAVDLVIGYIPDTCTRAWNKCRNGSLNKTAGRNWYNVVGTSWEGTMKIL